MECKYGLKWCFLIVVVDFPSECVCPYVGTLTALENKSPYQSCRKLASGAIFGP